MDVPRLLRPLSRVPRWAIFGFALTGLLLQAFGLYWDIWRHVVVGRESFFTPPHLVLYAGFAYVALAGIVGSVSGAIAPRWAGPRVRIVGLLVPVEFLLIGTGALFQAVAFPWDEAWHRLVAEGLVSETFWSPPHVMAIAGGIVSTFGFLLAVVLERTRWNGARTVLGLVSVALGAGLLLFSLQVLLGPMDFATSFNGQVLRDAIAYPTGVSLAAPAVLVVAASRPFRRRSTPACDRSWSSARSPCHRRSCSWLPPSIWCSSSSALEDSDSSPPRSRVARGRSSSTSFT